MFVHFALDGVRLWAVVVVVVAVVAGGFQMYRGLPNQGINCSAHARFAHHSLPPWFVGVGAVRADESDAVQIVRGYSVRSTRFVGIEQFGLVHELGSAAAV